MSFNWQGLVDGDVLPDGVYWLELYSDSLLGKCKVVVDGTPPAVPQLLLPGEQISEGKVRFVWDGASDISRYLLKVWQDQQSFTYEVFTTAFQLSEPLQRGSWFWQVEAFDGAGNSTVSAVRSFLLEPALPQVLGSATSQGPNPFSPNGNGRFERYQLIYSLSQPAAVRVTIFNLAGKEVYREEIR